MLSLLRNRNFRLLWLGGLISLTGDWALAVALPFEVYQRTGSTLATAGMVLAGLIPALLFGSVAGIFVDRWDRRRLMIGVSLAQAVGVLPLLLVDAVGLWVVYATLVISTLLKQLFVPAEVALLPRLVGEEHLVAANSLSTLNRNLSRLVGPAIGGATVAAGGLAAVVAVDAASFLAPALLIALIPAAASPHPRAHLESATEEVAAGIRAALGRGAAEWRDGLSRVWSNMSLRGLLLFSLITGIGEGVVGAVFVPWVSDVLKGDDAAYAAILSAQAAGGIIGAFVLARFLRGVQPARLLATSAILFGAIDLFIFGYPIFWPILWPAVVGMVIVGVPGTGLNVGFTTLQQTLTADSHRGRAIGLFGTVMALGAMVGTISGGLLGGTIGILPMLIVQGSGYIVGGLVVALSARRAAARDGAPETASA